MTYYELLKAITEVAKRHPNIKDTIWSDVYSLNSMPAAEFSVFAITPETIQEDYLLGIRYYTLNLYIIDRLATDGKPEMIHSQAIEELSNIIKTVVDENPIEANKVVYKPFSMAFQQQTAGCYATVTFELPVDDCYEAFE